MHKGGELIRQVCLITPALHDVRSSAPSLSWKALEAGNLLPRILLTAGVCLDIPRG